MAGNSTLYDISFSGCVQGAKSSKIAKIAKKREFLGENHRLFGEEWLSLVPT